MKIEELKEKDFLQLKELFKKLKKTSLMTIKNPEELAVGMLKIKKNKYGIVLTIKENQKIIGFANAVFMKPNQMDVGIGLLEDYRKKGIGTKAVKQLERELKAKYPSKKIILNAKIKEKNEASKKLFKKLGYEENGKEKEHVVFSKELL